MSLLARVNTASCDMGQSYRDKSSKNNTRGNRCLGQISKELLPNMSILETAWPYAPGIVPGHLGASSMVVRLGNHLINHSAGHGLSAIHKMRPSLANSIADYIHSVVPLARSVLV